MSHDDTKSSKTTQKPKAAVAETLKRNKQSY